MPTWTVPGYADIRELGHNGPGRTALGQHASTGVRVAIRYLPDELRRDDDYLAGYRSRTVGRGPPSPHVAGMSASTSSPATASRRARVRRRRVPAPAAGVAPIAPEAALTVLKAGLLGLAAVHTRGVNASGAYKPENILVDRPAAPGEPTSPAPPARRTGTSPRRWPRS